MAQSNYSNSFFATVGPAPAYPTTLPNGYTDGHLWVRVKIGCNPVHQWVGPIENTPNGLALSRTFAARKVAGLRSNREGRFYSSAWNAEIGQRYWQVIARQWKIIPVETITAASYREGLRRGDNRFGVQEQRQNRSAETDLSGSYGGYFPVDYPTEPLFPPPVYAVAYAMESSDQLGRWNSTEHTDFFGPLGGVNSLIGFHATKPHKDCLGQPNTFKGNNRLNAYFAVPPSVIPAGLIPLGVEVQMSQYNAHGRVMTRPDDLYGETSYHDYQMGMTLPIDDVRGKVLYYLPTDSNAELSYARVNQDTVITGPPFPNIPPELQQGTLAGAFDYTFYWWDVYYRYRVHYSGPKGEQVSYWEEDQGATRYCLYLRGPYELLQRNPIPFLFSDRIIGDGNCPDFNGHGRYRTIKADLPIPKDADGIAYFLHQACGSNGYLKVGESFKILGTGADGTATIPYFAVTPGSAYTIVNLNAVPIWSKDPTKFPNGASWTGWDYKVSWNYLPRTFSNPESVRISPMQMYLTTYANNPEEACPGTTAFCTMHDPPDDHIITTRQVKVWNNHFIPLWVQKSDATEPPYNTSSRYRFALEDGTVCYYRLGDQSGGPALPGKGIVGYGLVFTSSGGELTYSLPIYINGPLHFPTDLNIDIPESNQSVIPPFSEVSLVSPDTPIGVCFPGPVSTDPNQDPKTYTCIIYKSVQSTLITVTN